MKAIDLFAGAGGFTEGARRAGLEVVWAANHWPVAVEFHARNHPDTEHLCQDLHQADWSKVPSCDIVLASPCCQGHTKARGKDQPHHDASRSTAWAVVSCCEYHRPPHFIIENVPEFLNWKLYPAWRAAMEALGYHITTTVFDAALVSLPQNRVRLFIVGSLRKPVSIRLPNKLPRPIRDVIRFDEGKWNPIDRPGRSAATLRRVVRGRDSFGRRFVMPYYGSGSGLTGRSLDRPLGTVTARDRWAVVDGDRMRMFTVLEYKETMGFDRDYVLPMRRDTAIHLLGNAVPPPQAEHVIRQVAA